MPAYVCVVWPPSPNLIFQRPTGSVQSSTPDPAPAAPRGHEQLTDLSQNLCRRLHVRENPQGKPGRQVLYKVYCARAHLPVQMLVQITFLLCLRLLNA